MNCPKCNAPINDGDKFCQTCGSLVPQEEPKVEGNVPVEEPVQQPEPTPVTENQPVEPNQMPVPPMSDPGYTQVPMNGVNQPQPVNQNMNYSQQPMNNMNQPMNNMNSNQQPEPKKNNTVVYVLIAFILVLLAVVVFLLVSSGNDEDKDKTNNKTNNEVTENKKDEDKEEDKDEEEVIASNYTKTNVNEFTFELPKGYNAGYYGDSVVFYDEDMMDVEGYVLAQNGLYSSLDKEQAKLTLMSTGLENVSYEEKKLNNKRMVIFSGEYSGYDVDVIFVEYSSIQMVGAEVYYSYGTSETKEDVYDIVSRITVDDSAFSSDTNIRVPGLNLSGMIG